MAQIRVLEVPLKPDTGDYDRTHYLHQGWEDEDKRAIEKAIREVKHSTQPSGTRTVDTANGEVTICFKVHSEVSRRKLVKGFLELDLYPSEKLRSISEAITSSLNELGPRIADERREEVSHYLHRILSEIVLDDNDIGSGSPDVGTVVFDALLRALEIVSQSRGRKEDSRQIVAHMTQEIRSTLLDFRHTKPVTIQRSNLEYGGAWWSRWRWKWW